MAPWLLQQEADCICISSSGSEMLMPAVPGVSDVWKTREETEPLPQHLSLHNEEEEEAEERDAAASFYRGCLAAQA